LATLLPIFLLVACGGGGEDNSGATRWVVTLTSSTPCYRPQQALALTVRAYDAADQLLPNPSYTVAGAPAGSLLTGNGGTYLVGSEGTLQVTVTYAGPTAQGATIAPATFTLVSDATPPQFTIDAPLRAAMLVGSGAVALAGAVTDAVSTVDTVWLDGTEMPGTPATLRSIAQQLPAAWGLNLIELAAVDHCGNRAERVQSFLQSGQYLAPPVAADAASWVGGAVTTSISADTIDDDNRNDPDDLATLIERVAAAQLPALLAKLRQQDMSNTQAPSCPGLGYRVNVRSPALQLGEIRVLAMIPVTASPLGELRHSYELYDVAAPVDATLITAGVLCAQTDATVSTEFSMVSARVDLGSSVRVLADGTVDVSTRVINVNFSGVDIDLTGISFIDTRLSQIGAALAGEFARAAASRVVELMEPQIGAMVSMLARPQVAVAGLQAEAALESVRIASDSLQQTWRTQIRPVAAVNAEPVTGPITRAMATTAFPATVPLAFSVNDNAINQGLWALWRGGWFDLEDALDMPGVTMRITAKLPPVLGAVAGGGEVQFGLGDLEIGLDMKLIEGVLPPASGQIHVDLYASYTRQGTVTFDRLFQRFRLSGDQGRAALQIQAITRDGTALTDPPAVAAIREFLAEMIPEVLDNLAEESLAATPLPAGGLALSNGMVEGTVTLGDAARIADRVLFLPQFSVGRLPAATPPPGAFYALNNPWNATDLDNLDIPARIHDSLLVPHIAGDNPDANSTTPALYASRKDDCTADTGTNGNCLTDWKRPLEYGWYCGGGRPISEDDGGRGMSAPMLDPVDACCRIHDQNKFDNRTIPGVGRKPDSISPVNACGFAMCLAGARGYPEGIGAFFPQIERARQKMYDWAKALCPGVQPLDLPAIEVQLP